MILELLLVTCICLAILIFFYKQTMKEFRLSQTDDLAKMPALIMSEKTPIVVHPFQIPGELWSVQEINQRHTLANLMIPMYDVPLINAVNSNQIVQWTPSFAQQVADATGLPVWFSQTFQPIFKAASHLAPIYSYRTEVYLGPQGLQKTYGLATVLAVTDGDAAVTLLNEQSDPYLPIGWQGKLMSQMTRDDAPLIGQIQCIDVVLRPGSCLVLPPHWKYCIEKKSSAQICSVKMIVHHPVSMLMEKAGAAAEIRSRP